MTTPHSSNKREVLSEVSFLSMRRNNYTHSMHLTPENACTSLPSYSSFPKFTQLDPPQAGYPCSPSGMAAVHSFDFHRNTS